MFLSKAAQIIAVFRQTLSEKIMNNKPSTNYIAMTDHPIVAKLYQDYINNSGKFIEEPYFESVMLFFPAISIVACDGVIDEEEWFNLDNLTDFMSRSHKDRFKNSDQQCPLKDVFTEHVNYLAVNIKDWEDKFLDCLEEYLKSESQFKETIYEIIETFAELSEGISEVEALKIDALNKKLALLDE